ncbi:MAG TPA: chromate transporter [Oscillospiraceae bacterium]|nr:chromate transporter [Oscillospiraceae bacterium]
MSYWSFFLTVFKVSAITFGGGYTIVPVLKDEFCNKHQCITEDEMLDIVALGQAAPGPIAISVALLMGYRLKGRIGALLGVLAGILPPMITISVIYFFYETFATNYWVRAALRGMSGAIAAVMLMAVFSMARQVLRKHKVFTVIVLVGAFALAWFTTINTALLILTFALIGILVFSLKDRQEKGNES